MSRALAVLSLLLLLAGAACAREAAEEAAEVPADQAASGVANAPEPPPLAPERGFDKQAGADAAQQAAPVAPLSRKLIKTVDIQMLVADTAKAAREAQLLAVSLGGYVANMTAQRQNGLLHYSITLRVPVERLDAALERVRRLGEQIERESVRSEDVTEQFVDLEARLTTLRATEHELLELLSEARERGQKLEDVMAVYRELTEIRTSIEQIQGQLKALTTLTTLSTINLELLPAEAGKPLVEEWRPAETIRASARALVKLLQALVDLAIWLLVTVVPVVVLLALLIWVLLRLRRRFRRPPATPS
ncbi:MAG TPA: DUF4349 domain-containing protein [Thermoanaerobaculia bacterium]|nr:DUF4349 domain-containing protein [Thermoanaerobaculia bacterium]